MFDGGREREALDALCAPLRGDTVARCAPDLFRIALEEGEVELAAEAVDEEVFQRFLVAAREELARLRRESRNFSSFTGLGCGVGRAGCGA